MQLCPSKYSSGLSRPGKSDVRLFPATYIERVVPYLPWWICSLPLISPTSNLLESFSMFNTSALMFCKALDDATKVYLRNSCELWNSTTYYYRVKIIPIYSPLVSSPVTLTLNKKVKNVAMPLRDRIYCILLWWNQIKFSYWMMMVHIIQNLMLH